MILSNSEIHRAIDEKRLVIEPEPIPRVPQSDDDCPYQTSAVDLSLSDEISYFKEGIPVNLDLSKGGFATYFSNNSETQTLTQEQPFVLKPNRLILGRTQERIALPIIENSQCLAARVEGKSSYARCGLLVHFTAPTIHAGFDGTITLELINLGPFDITLRPDVPICQLIIETVLGTPFRNDSQFQGQTAPGGIVY